MPPQGPQPTPPTSKPAGSGAPPSQIQPTSPAIKPAPVLLAPNVPPPAPPGSQAPIAAPTPPPPRPKKSFKGLLLGLLVIVLISGVIAGASYVYLRPGGIRDQQREAARPKPQYEILATAYDALRDRGVGDFAVEDRDTTIAAFKQLTTGFEFKDLAITSDSSKQLIILGAAREFHAGRVDEQISRTKIYMVLQDDLVTVPSGIKDEDANIPKLDQARTIYTKYADPALTDKLKAAIQTRGLEAKTMKALKLEGQSIQAYDLYAMTFNAKTPEEESFRKDMLYSGTLQPIWTQTYPDARLIGFTKSFANEFALSNTSLTEAYFLHEFSHTQKPLIRGLGTLLEERRAEEISGNKGAYFDVKQFFIYLNVAIGYDVVPLLQASPADAEKVYIDIYKNLGTELADAVIASFPVSYLPDAASPVKAISARHNLESTLQLALKLGREKDATAQRKRIAERGDKLVATFGSRQKALDDLQNNLATKYAMKSMAEEMRRYLIGVQ